MSEFAREIIQVNIEHELKQSYLDYSMSVIVGRALPDVRDGLKPVHRRVIFAMKELGNDYNKPYKKSARIVGDVIGKYHPHGDTAVYDTIVRMAQPFSMRYVMVDGQGNFGSVDGDSPAAMRYTEIRMAKITHTMLDDLDKDTVDFLPNYDGTEFIPEVLPTRFPTLLINGSSGIAVGMATNIPPHNLTEVVNACIALIDNPALDFQQLLELIPGPDFPTAGIIYGRQGIVQGYKTGRGRVLVRARAQIETENNGKATIIVTELPYQVNKARLIEKIALLVKEKKIDGISAIRDESDKQGMRIVIEVKRGENADVLLNNLYQQTRMQSYIGFNMVALIEGRPKCLSLREILDAFIQHRCVVVTRRTLFLLAKAKNRGHILEGLGIALANIDEMIALIKASKNPAEAKEAMLARPWNAGQIEGMLKDGADLACPDHLLEQYGLKDDGYHLSPDQAQAILELRLHRLTGLERDKIIEEYKKILDDIRYLLEILASKERLMEVIREELVLVRDQFGDERLTEMVEGKLDITDEDLIAPEEVVITISNEGYVKSQPLDQYQAQKRGGKGKSATSMKDEDYIRRLVVANTHDMILCFSNAGRVYWLKAYQIPQASRQAKGRPIVNLLSLDKDELITAILPLKKHVEGQYVFMATEKGTVKKVEMAAFSRPRSSGLNAVDLVEGDHLIGVALTDGESDIMLFSNAGKVIRFNESDVRSMGRTARGVRGIRLKEGQRVISLIVNTEELPILVTTENGYGKRTAFEQFRKTARGGQGIIAIAVSERNGDVIDARRVSETDDVLLISNKGTMVRTHANEISMLGRNTQGVRLIKVSNDEKLIAVQRVEDVSSDDDNVNEDSED